MTGRCGSERGEVQVGIWVIVAVIAVLGALPFVLMMRSDVDSAEQAVGAIDTANDAQAKVILTNAVRGAQVYFAENGTLTGYGVDAARLFDPTVVYSAGPARQGQVSIRGVGSTTAVLVSLGGSGPLCVAVNGDIVTYGFVDASSAAECSGSSWA